MGILIKKIQVFHLNKVYFYLQAMPHLLGI